MVRSPPPRIFTFVASTFVLVTVMVMGFGPQLNTTVPPAASAASNATSVQLPGVPSPTIDAPEADGSKAPATDRC
jgi:hypothetical protein